MCFFNSKTLGRVSISSNISSIFFSLFSQYFTYRWSISSGENPVEPIMICAQKFIFPTKSAICPFRSSLYACPLKEMSVTIPLIAPLASDNPSAAYASA